MAICLEMRCKNVFSSASQVPLGFNPTMRTAEGTMPTSAMMGMTTAILGRSSQPRVSRDDVYAAGRFSTKTGPPLMQASSIGQDH
jgi:hypothetical protein